MRPDRLLLVIDGMEVGGSQRQLLCLLRGLDRTRWAPEVAYFRDASPLLDAVRAEGVPVHHVPKRRRVDPPFVMAFARLLRARDYALVHAFSLTAELWSLPARRLSGRMPVLVASERSANPRHPTWYWWAKRLVVGHAAAVIANTTAGAEATAHRTGAARERFTAIGNGIAPPAPLGPGDRCEIREALRVVPRRLLGLFVGRLVAAKNVPCLLRALARIPPAGRPCIAIAGEGPLRATLEDLARALDVAGDVRFLGERADATRLMQAADFLVLPSRFEGLSNALLEAMAAGCPVLASAVGGTPELVEDGRSGLLFADDDDAALAALMRRMDDRDLRDRLSRAAARHVERHHGVAAMAAATSAVYERCLEPRTRGAPPHRAAPLAGGGPP
ncbi:glycosyltransferase [Luteimonas pelagia]